MNSVELRKKRLRQMSPEQRSEAKIEAIDDLRILLDHHFEKKADRHRDRYGKDLRAENAISVKRTERNM